MTCGIYILRFNNTNKVYIGQSLNIENRYTTHLKLMKQGDSSKKLNDAFIEYGAPSLEVLIECSEAELNNSENEAIELFNSVSDGFNSNNSADTCPILHGEEHGASKHTNDTVEKIFELLLTRYDLTYKDIAKLTKTTPSIVSQIKNGYIHRWLEGKYPEKYSKLNLRPKYLNCGLKYTKYPDILSPEGRVYSVSNTTSFAKEHDLNQSNLSSVLRGIRKSHKGWKLADIGDIS